MAGTMSFRQAFGSLSDDEWQNRWMAYAKGEALEPGLPAFPDAEIQARFVGSSFEAAMREAFAFYRHVKAQIARRGEPLGDRDVFLDFGCGWGRYLRLFARDIPVEHLFGVDVLPEAVEVCRAGGVPGNIDVIEPRGRLPRADGEVTAAIAYSVFTHLPEDVHRHWSGEFARVMAPGGILVLTVQPRRFLDWIERLDRMALGRRILGMPTGWLRPWTRRPELTPWQRTLISNISRLADMRARYDAGELVYMASGGGAGLPSKTYGDAVAPLPFLRSAWGPHFEIIDHVDDPARFVQAVVTLRRTPA